MVHAPLDIPSRQLACGEFIEALHACHAKGMLYRLSGACNDEKYALSMCLRKERLERTERNREEAKERNRKKKEAFAALDREGE